MPNKRKPRASRFEVSGASRTGRSLFDLRIPVRWLNFVIGLFLLIPAAVWTQTFFTVSRISMRQGFWATEEFWFFALGAVLWVITFFGLPRPVLIYVFGHELTHAVWVWLMGGRVSKFSVSSDGGHIVTNKHNFWIALAPYFFPLYSILVILIYGAAGFFFHMPPHPRVLFALIGGTWAFHITFTLWMIPKGQTDLTYYGTFFSLVIIYLMNLLVLTIFLVTASHITFLRFTRLFYHNAQDFSAWACSLVR
jgi:hypothetical protein